MKIGKNIAIVLIRLKMRTLSAISPRKAAGMAFRLFCTPLPNAPKAPGRIFDGAEDLAFTFGGLTLRGYGWKHNRNKNVLILHGFSSNVYKFEHFVQPLLDRGFGVLAFDAPAHGRSGGKTVNAVVYAGVVGAVIDQYGPLHGVVAHSFGGLAVCLAMEKAAHPPVKKIALIAPAAETTTAISNAFQLLGIRQASVRAAFDALVLRISGYAPEWFSIRRTLPHIDADILWVQDADDTITPLADVQPAETEGHKHVRFMHTQGLGHHKIYRDPTVVNQVIAFL